MHIIYSISNLNMKGLRSQCLVSPNSYLISIGRSCQGVVRSYSLPMLCVGRLNDFVGASISNYGSPLVVWCKLLLLHLKAMLIILGTSFSFLFGGYL